MQKLIHQAASKGRRDLTPIGHPSMTAGVDHAESSGDLAGIEGAAIVLGELLLHAGQTVDRGRLRRVVRHAAEAFPGDASLLWWRWISEAGANLGLKCKVVDCTPNEFCDLARDGTKMVHYAADSDPWRAVVDVRGRHFRKRDYVSRE